MKKKNPQNKVEEVEGLRGPAGNQSYMPTKRWPAEPRNSPGKKKALDTGDNMSCTVYLTVSKHGAAHPGGEGVRDGEWRHLGSVDHLTKKLKYYNCLVVIPMIFLVILLSPLFRWRF